jgi:intracellular sulfur oxidation DsrE/DsrF family protein
MTSRRDFLALAGAATAQPVFPDIAPLLARAVRHRQVFGIRRIAGGMALEQIKNSLNAYEFARREGAGTLHVIAVLYGPAIALALRDEVWSRLHVGAVLARAGEDVAVAPAGVANPYLRNDIDPDSSDPANPRSRVNDASLHGLQARGVTFLVCNNALAHFAQTLATTSPAAGSVEAAARALRDGMVGGALLVPAGVAALNDAQEARYTYVAAS